MQREVDSLAATPLDLLIIGGGAYGVCAAWEAARRGLRVAVIDRGDFGAATSNNSLQTMHGGLRYLQHLDLRRMRESIRERRHWLQFAPDLIKPVAFLMPTYGLGLRGPPVMAVALALNDLISLDRNRGVLAAGHLPRGRQLSRRAARARCGELQIADHNGAALWYDGFNQSPGRLLMRVLRRACAAGAHAANYCVVEELLCEEGRIAGAVIRNTLSGAGYKVRSRMVLNAAGPWVDEIAALAGRSAAQPLFSPSKAMNLVVRRIPLADAMGVPVVRRTADTDTVLNKGSLTHFIMPWGDYSLIGTKHLHCQGSGDALRVKAADVSAFLDELNPTLGPWRLNMADVLAVKCGLLPAQHGQSADGDVILQKHARIVDHEGEDGIRGLVSMVGVKWTTARLVAEQTIELICGQLKRSAAPVSATVSVGLASTLTDQGAGTAVVADSNVTDAQIVAAARDAMAVTLSDAVWRRTELWLSQQLDAQALRRVAGLMAPGLAWSAEDVDQQVALTQQSLVESQAWRTATG